MIFFLVLLNFVISYFNAWACGKAWPETKHNGGWAHFMNWMGAIMSACGFTWCFLVIIAVGGSAIPYDSHDPKHIVYAVSPEMLRAIFELGYLIIIGPILGSGLAITVDSWAHFYRKRTFGSGALATYNTAAQMYNMYEAASAVPAILKDLGGLFAGKSSDSSSSDGEGGLSGILILIVVLVVICALVGGILLTRAIIISTARKSSVERNFQFSSSD